ncbi:hypothetical protein PACTADRAFT_185769 [Pachysolen tannophilus NRRL Y-2460]|uniref:Redoxin domain-containing protein n=1 Tax=Pachysolen tannophilus NRRL Y-2460 TaxID=669874 RepID=A0A1E4U1N2_PACTA|nr:hypothetical protein PACTADRAFT_185769 [Pachysolen tannophilus NRRL Y-2460]
MSINLQPGDRFPLNVKFNYIPFEPNSQSCRQPIKFNCDEQFKGKKVIIVSIPAAFSPTCSENHIPPFIERLPHFLSKGIDLIVVLSANDPFVMNAFAHHLGVKNNKIVFVNDPSACFSKSIGFHIEDSGNSNGMGIRSGRYAIIIDNLIVRYCSMEIKRTVNVSSADTLLSKL